MDAHAFDLTPEQKDLLIALAGQGVTATCSVPEGPRYGAIELDSNLPDVRIALGGPEENDFTAQVLAAAGPAATIAFDSQMAATGSARIWVPGARSRRESFTPGADLRGPTDLPVLVVAGTDLRATIDALIDRGARVDLADVHGYTPLLIAVQKGFLEAAQVLVRRGADLHRKSKAGETALALARASGNTALVAYLRQAGAAE